MSMVVFIASYNKVVTDVHFSRQGKHSEFGKNIKIASFTSNLLPTQEKI